MDSPADELAEPEPAASPPIPKLRYDISDKDMRSYLEAAFNVAPDLVDYDAIDMIVASKKAGAWKVVSDGLQLSSRNSLKLMNLLSSLEPPKHAPPKPATAPKEKIEGEIVNGVPCNPALGPRLSKDGKAKAVPTPFNLADLGRPRSGPKAAAPASVFNLEVMEPQGGWCFRSDLAHMAHLSACARILSMGTMAKRFSHAKAPLRWSAECNFQQQGEVVSELGQNAIVLGRIERAERNEPALKCHCFRSVYSEIRLPR